MKSKTQFLATAVITTAILAVSASAATIVYEDNFDNDTLATNTGIGGGLTQRTILTATFGDNGNLVDTAGSNGGTRGVVSSINSFNLLNGFILEVRMNGGTTAIAQSFGLSKTQFTADTSAEDWMREQSWAGEGTAADAYGIGVQTGSSDPGASEPTPRGLKFNNGAANGTAITNLVTTTNNLLPAGVNTFVLTVTPNDQFSYVYNGGAPVTGEIVPGAGVFDLTQPLFFNVYSQSDISLSYVKITSIPEPSAALLGGLGLLALLRRRR